MGRQNRRRHQNSNSDAEKSNVSDYSRDGALSQTNQQSKRSCSRARKTDEKEVRDSQLKISAFTVPETDSYPQAKDRPEQGSDGIAEVISRITSLEVCVKNGNEVLMEKLEMLAGQIFDLQTENKELKSRVQLLQEKQIEDAEEILRLTTQVKEGREKINEIEQQGRKDNLRFFGIEGDNPKENIRECEKKILHIVSHKLGLPYIGEKDISIAHRTGKPVKGTNRAVVVKFISRKIKNEILYNRKKLKGSAVSIQEDLTRINAVRLSRLSKHEEVKQSWSKNGKLYVSLKNSDHVVQVTEESQLEEFLSRRTHGGGGSRTADHRQHRRQDQPSGPILMVSSGRPAARGTERTDGRQRPHQDQVEGRNRAASHAETAARSTERPQMSSSPRFASLSPPSPRIPKAPPPAPAPLTSQPARTHVTRPFEMPDVQVAVSSPMCAGACGPSGGGDAATGQTWKSPVKDTPTLSDDMNEDSMSPASGWG